MYQSNMEYQEVLPKNNRHTLNRLICSFKSDFPNEIDFAMQVSTLLANTNNFTWSEDYLLIDAICESLHVYTCVCNKTHNCYCYPRFWHKLIDNNPYLQEATISQDIEFSFLNFNTLQDHDLNDHVKIYRRVKLVAELILQFSMITKDVKNKEHSFVKKKVKASPALLKFVSLLYHCDDKAFNLIGLDILSNISSKLSKVRQDVTCTKLVHMFQEQCVSTILQDGDIYLISRSLEVVSKLISSSGSILSNLISKDNIISRLEQLLTSQHDVRLFLSALEFCHSISIYQPQILTGARTKYLLKILVNLLTCDDNRYFTVPALKKVKVSTGAAPGLIAVTPVTGTDTPAATVVPRVVPPAVPSTVTPVAPPVVPSAVTPVVPSAVTPVVAPVVPPVVAPVVSSAVTPVVPPVVAPVVPSAVTPVVAPVVPSAVTPAVPSAVNPVVPSAVTPAVTPAVNSAVNSAVNPVVPSAVTPAVPSAVTPVVPSAVTPVVPSAVTPVVPSAVPSAVTPAVNSAVNSAVPSAVTPAVPPVIPSSFSVELRYNCRWNGCQVAFLDPKDVYKHVFVEHVGSMPAETLSSCLWSGPQGSGPGCLTKRPKFSLLTHLNDFHCNLTALNRAQPIQPPEHPGYASNAAVLAIKRHTHQQKAPLQHRSILSTSVRLTAAIIVRNLARESSSVKQFLENYESLLSEISMSEGDEGKIVAECLSLICEKNNNV